MLILNNVKPYILTNKLVKVYATDKTEYKKYLNEEGFEIILKKEGVVISFHTKKGEFTLNEDQTYNFIMNKKFTNSGDIYFHITQIEESNNCDIIQDIDEEEEPYPDTEILENLYNELYETINNKIRNIEIELKNVGTEKNIENTNKLHEILFSNFSEKNNI
jgi:hypothetical protein